MTEHVWQEVVRRYSNESAESVHLSTWPKVLAGVDVNDSVLTQVQEVRDIISLALKLRNEKQVRIRQPLQTLYVCGKEGKIALAPELENVLASEVNVKELAFLEDTSALEDAYAVLDFKKAGAVLKADVNHVKNLLAGLSAEDMHAVAAAVQAGGEVRVPGYDAALSAEIFALKHAPKAHLAVAEDHHRRAVCRRLPARHSASVPGVPQRGGLRGVRPHFRPL